MLVTGAGGLVGGALCAELLGRGHGVVGLMHRTSTIFANDGRRIPAAPWTGGAITDGRLMVLEGDVSRPDFALGSAAARDLALYVDVIAHCAGVTGFDLAPSVYDAVNVFGAANVADFALAAGDRAPGLAHVSTAYVCGDQSGSISESLSPGRRHFTNGYEASKARAEIEIADRRRRRLRAAIVRPSIVVGDSTSGAIRRFDHFYGLVKLVAEGRIRELPGTSGATLDLAPIDHVAQGLADIVERIEAADGGVFHLVADAPVPLTALTELGRDYPDLQPARFIDPAIFDTAALSPSRRRAFKSAAEVYAPYLCRNPRFVAKNLERLSGRVCPRLGAPFLRRLVDYAIAQGYVRRPRANARRGSSDPAAS